MTTTNTGPSDAEAALFDRAEHILACNDALTGTSGQHAEGLDFGNASLRRDADMSISVRIGETHEEYADDELDAFQSSYVRLNPNKTVGEALVSVGAFEKKIRGAAQISFVETIALQLEQELLDAPQIVR